MGYVELFAEPGTALKAEQRGKLFDVSVTTMRCPSSLSPQEQVHDLFTREHEWIRVEGDTATVGISDHAQGALGDIVFAEVPEAGRRLTKGQEAAIVKSVKAASDVYSPVAGEVVEGNSAVADDPALVNRDPEGEGWFFKVKLDNPGDVDGLLDEAALPRVGGDAERSDRLDQPLGRGGLCPHRAVRVHLGEAALDLLDPKIGERILDIGCGDGALTHKIVERGADVVGVDNSPELVAAARAIGLEVLEVSAADMTFDAEFDAAFSNAALHWMLDKERAAEATFRALKPVGRYAGEMGGDGDLAKLRETLDAELVARGYPPPLESSNWYPSVDEFAAVYDAAGFAEIDARLIERPTLLPNGIGQWVTTFRRGWLDRAGVPEEERAEIGEAVADTFGSPTADYVRLRFIMRKPD